MTGPPSAAGTLPRHVVVVGCGRLGSLLAARLSAAGCNVVVIDRSESSFDRLPPEFSGFRIAGDASELAVLRSAETSKAGCLLATTENDNVNLMVAQVARTEFRVPRVLVRIFDPNREAIYEEFGIHAVSPTRLAVDEFLRALAAGEGGEAEPTGRPDGPAAGERP